MILQANPVVAIQLRAIIGASIGDQLLVRSGGGIIFLEMQRITYWPVFINDGPLCSSGGKSKIDSRIGEQIIDIITGLDQ